MRLKITLSLLLLATSSAQAAISVYNPDTGKTEVAPILDSTSKPALPQIMTEPIYKEKPRRKVQPILLPEEEEAAKLAEKGYPLGEVFFFVDVRQYTPELAAYIQKLEQSSNLKLQAYMESKNPKEYARDILMMQRTKLVDAERDAERMAQMPELKADSGNRAFGYHRPGGWHKVVYYDATGSKRVYDLKHELSKLDRHIKRSERMLKKGRR